jgi:hypothetical protein
MVTFWRQQTTSGGNYPPSPPNAPGVPFWPQTLGPATLVGRLLGTGPTEAIPISYLVSFLAGLVEVQVETAAGAIAVALDTQVLIINKALASVTPITLPSALLRNNLPLEVYDWTGLGGDMTFTPFGSEKINNLSSWIVGSGGAGLGGSLLLRPNATISGWLAR